MPDRAPVARRVHVVPLGFEYARLKQPIEQWRADVVVAVEYCESQREIAYLQQLLSELRENDRIDLHVLECDIFDLYDTLGTLTATIGQFPTDEVFVNLSGGSKITAIAGMIACMATDARPLYARPSYGSTAERIPTEPLHDEVAETFELPRYPIERPSQTLLAFLEYIDQETTTADAGRYRGVHKKALIEFASEQQFPFITESTAATEKGFYRLLESHFVSEATTQGYIAIEKVGRKKFITLTEAGENTLTAFGHLISK
ncbi:DUF6293 family protein [Halomarina rubra]|uniref:DUF6293 family protein n=1 Tax=Halomarina rubra TaxID=2071873 RepID=A0ABD6AXT9_9EURY|nr:DUF6293 family protein [Halomarina rubra]